MIEIPVHNQAGEQVDTLQVDEQLLGGEVRPGLLKQAYVRFHANRRIGAAKTRTRSELARSGHKLYRQKGTGQARRGDANANLLRGGYHAHPKNPHRSELARSGHKLYRQKGTGQARRGDANANLLRGGSHAHPKKPHSWRQDMPKKMRRLANRNALLAKAVDNEIKVVDSLPGNDKPSTKQFIQALDSLGIDRSCLFALDDERGTVALSARNLDQVSITQIDRLNAFDLLNHRYLLVEREAFEAYLGRVQDRPTSTKAAEQEAA